MSRGEIWWLEHPEAGRRPACVLTRQAAVEVLRSVVVVMATRTVRGIPSELVLDEGDGMPAPCALSFDNLETVPKAFLTERITRLTPARMREACRMLGIATGC